MRLSLRNLGRAGQIVTDRHVTASSDMIVKAKNNLNDLNLLRQCLQFLNMPAHKLDETHARLFTHATIITVNSAREVILDGALFVNNGRIAALGKTAELLPQAQAAEPRADIIDCTDKIIIPGLINTHAHLAQSLLRGLAENLPLHSWLCDAIWPLEANYAEEDGYVAALLTIAEMLKTGTTCFLEAMLTHRSGFENVVKAVEETGIRACLGKLIKAVETNPELKLKDARDRDAEAMSLSSALSAHGNYHSSFNNRLHVWFAASTPRGSPLSAHAAIGEAAMKHDIGLTMHCAEAPKDLTIYREYYQCSPLQFCKEAKLTSRKSPDEAFMRGLGRTRLGPPRYLAMKRVTLGYTRLFSAGDAQHLGPSLFSGGPVFAHVVWPDPSAGDFVILRESKSTVSHNPTSNLKLGSGLAPIPDMVAAGVNVALGTDGAPCNNTYDMLREMHIAAILHSGVRQSADVLSAYQVLEFATINGARALGLEEDIGSLEVGKKADLVVAAPKGVCSGPWDAIQVEGGGTDPVTTMVHSSGVDIDTVLVDGRTLVSDGQLLHIDEANIVARAKDSIAGIRERSGVGARNHMSLKYT